MRHTLAGESLDPERILLKDENIEQLFLKVGVPPAGGLTKTPLVICGLAALS
ncbi:hypothetical protein AXF42_Ash020837 [Apostasia shenzhenica]|uniref:Uncharacterized protein n=1 Tax=Apostasia shenzhenica TaxID=1088818 RepID=A0A2I0A3C4_9ASPA|nr:hypothetical protein AXF42_Ash020837 [Apostasia shenzhenica]